MTGVARRFSPLRDLPAVLWLLAVVAVALVHRSVPAPRWLLFHLLLLGAVTHSIMVWSQHFTEALLHVPPAPPRPRSTRLALLNAGVVVVLAGVLRDSWTLASIGATAVAVAVVWHGGALLGMLRGALGSRFAPTVRYYVAGAAVLPVGLTFGVLMVRGLPEEWHARVMVAHVAVNVFGLMGMAVLGTLVTPWPTMLRTRVVTGVERAARRALPVLLSGLAVVVAGCLAGVLPLAGVGFLLYGGGAALLMSPFLQAARARRPEHYATGSVLAAVGWFLVVLLAVGVGIAVAPDWMAAHEWLSQWTPALAVGFGAQVLLGALSYLVPVSVGRGPAGTRAANIELDRGSALRVTVTNLGLGTALLPVPSTVRVALAALVLCALAAFVPLMFLGMRAARRAYAAPPDPATARRRGPQPAAAQRPPGQLAGLAATGLALVVVATAVGVAMSPSSLIAPARADAAAAGVMPTGHTTRVVVRAANMRFTPGTITVASGNRLVLDVRNTDTAQVHDLVLDTGATTGRLSPGQHARLDAGVVGRDVEGWCSIVGHRQMGMVLHIRVRGAAHPDGMPAMAAMPGMSGTPGATEARAATVPPRTRDPRLPPIPTGHVHRRTLRIVDVRTQVAPHRTQTLWTYNGTMPGPILHGRLGDRFVIRVVNHTSMTHSIDFHAGDVSPDRPMRAIPPGGSLTYRFTAHRSGIWLYHCSTMPMSAHIANGMFGAVIIDPPGLPSVAHQYVLVQSELYLGLHGGPVDVDKLRAERPDLVVFNGYADQYDDHPLRARAGERVGIWVLGAGGEGSCWVVVVGAQFDTVYSEGAYLLRPGPLHGGSQVLQLGPAQGGFVEMRLPHPGHYAFVSHLMLDAERGAHGVLRVTR
ncbi:MAG: multicopper oxidase domain-containing protein [Marmoricola sp.]